MGFRFWSATATAALVAVMSTDCVAGEKLFTCITPKHTIEIQQSDGGGSVSYRSWNTPATTTSPPNLAIENGTVEADDSQGGATLHLYKFHLTNTDILVSDGPLLSGLPSAKSGEVKVFINGQERSHYDCSPPAESAPPVQTSASPISGGDSQVSQPPPGQATTAEKPASSSGTEAPSPSTSSATNSSSGGTTAFFGFMALIFLVLGALAVTIYFLPSIIAFNRKHREKWAIFAVNLFLGFTAVGWWISLIWALRSDEKREQSQTIIIQQSNSNNPTPHVIAQNVVATVAPAPAAQQPTPPSVSPPSSTSQPAPSSAIISQHQIAELTRLGALRDSGVLTDDEFQKAKSTILQQNSQS